jgi:uncharacterized protein YcfJ
MTSPVAALLLALTCLPCAALAADYEDTARIVSVDQRVEQSRQPHQECGAGAGAPAQPGVAGLALGGVAGGVVGSQIGKGRGKLAATAVGAVAGAVIGNQIQNGGLAQAQPRCVMVNDMQTRVVGYQIAYEYQGRTYIDNIPAMQNAAPIAYKPGDVVRVQVHLAVHQ